MIDQRLGPYSHALSPEQARGQSDVDSAADLYVLGVMVFASPA